MPYNPTSHSVHTALAKCVRNAEIPEPHLSSLLRDLCVLFETDNPIHFDRQRFIYIANGGILKEPAYSRWKYFSVMKYLDEVRGNK
jgi:hypothetical protein